MRHFKYLFSFLILSLVVFTSCKHNNGKESKSTGADFDRGAMLTNIGNNIIVPSFNKLSVATNSLDSAAIVFTANPSASNLTNLQTVFKDTYKAWQYCSPFCSPWGYGIDEQKHLGENVNSFATDTNLINQNITSGSYNFGDLSNRPSMGFPAIDYLLFGTGADNTAILDKYTIDSKAESRKKYLTDLTKNIYTRVNNVYTSWIPTGGNYINTFVTSTGKDIASSTSKFVNTLDQDLDGLKYYKIALPIGVIAATQPLQSINPDQVEGFYSGISVDLAVTQLKAIENIYKGYSVPAGDGVGLDDYLDNVGSSSLNAEIKNQFIGTENALKAVPSPLSNTIKTESVINDKDKKYYITDGTVKAAFNEMQILLVLFKKEMSSDLAIQINYPDADGD